MDYNLHKTKMIAISSVVFSLFLIFICLTSALSYPGARVYSCGTPAATIEWTVKYLVPLGVLISLTGWWFVRSAPVVALLTGGVAFMSLVTWLGTLAFIMLS